jgi:intracellular septation protein
MGSAIDRPRCEEVKNDPPIDQKKRPNKIWLDFGPLFFFSMSFYVLRHYDPQGAIFTAAGIFICFALAAVIISKLKYGYISKFLMFSTIVIIVTASVSIFTKNPVFIYIKPTIVNVIMGSVILGSVFAKKNLIQFMAGDIYRLPDRAWDVLAIRWGLFFYSMAIGNEILWRFFSETIWVTANLLGIVWVSSFAALQIPYVRKHAIRISD